MVVGTRQIVATSDYQRQDNVISVICDEEQKTEVTNPRPRELFGKTAVHQSTNYCDNQGKNDHEMI